MIKHDETFLIGKWNYVDGKFVADQTCSRISDLIKNHLVKIADSEAGWESLYLDPIDGRLWELSYPESDLHGGGPPMLRLISEIEARSRYKDYETS